MQVFSVNVSLVLLRMMSIEDCIRSGHVVLSALSNISHRFQL